MKNKIKKQTLLSTLWVFVLFNMIFRDLHQFLANGYIEKMMSQEVSDVMLLLYGFILELPILMVLLSRILNNKVNKWANMMVATVTMLGILSTLPSADLDDIFFGVIKVSALIAILAIAWKLPSHQVVQ
ncbi:MAG: DUF6326 family protein [Bacteroidota bacterium]